MTSTKPLKVFHIITRLNVGGAALYNLLLANELRALGDDVWLIYGSVEKTEGDMLDFWEGPRLFREVKISELSREIRPFKDAVAFIKLLALIWKEKPDVVHTHTSKAGLLGRLAAILSGVPVKIHSFHGTVFKGYFGGIMNSFIERCERALGRYTECIFADTSAVKDQAISHHVAPVEKFRVVPLGLDLDGFSELSPFRGTLRARLGLGNDVPLVGMVARLVPIKGVENFLRAIARVKSKSPSAHFVIVGDGELRQELEQLSRELGISDRVSFVGFWKELREIYAEIDILVLSSLSEGCPIAILEAMAAGIPVIASSVGGVVDVVRDGVNGLLFPSGDSGKLAECLARLLESPQERNRLAGAAKKDAFEKYTIKQSALVTQESYESLLRSVTGRRVGLVKKIVRGNRRLGPSELPQ